MSGGGRGSEGSEGYTQTQFKQRREMKHKLISIDSGNLLIQQATSTVGLSCDLMLRPAFCEGSL